MMPKFTLITHDFPPAKGGVARYLSSLAAASQGMMDVWVPENSSYVECRTSNENTSADVRRSTFDVSKVKFQWPLWPHWLPLVKRCLEVPQDNIILVSHVFPIGTSAWIANALGGSEYAVIFHGTDLKRAQTKWKRWLLRRICNNAKALIVNSQATERLLKRLVPKADPLVLTPGLDPFDLPDKSEARSRLNVAPGTKVILAVSRLVERKGIDTLIQAVVNLTPGTWNLELGTSNNDPRIINTDATCSKYESEASDAKYDIESSDAKYEIRYSKYELVILGNGQYAEPLHKLAKLSGVDVRWVSDADDETLHDWYSAADIFCLPGRETADDVEGFGMVFLEASYAGLPVIAGASGGTSEAVINNETGLIIPPTVDACTEALQKLLNDPNLASQFGQSGHERVKTDFNWSDRWKLLSSCLSDSSFSGSPDLASKSDAPQDISVVIPCYNHAFELRDTLESLINQTLSVKQVIIVDDASTDNPETAVQEFVDLLPIQFIRLAQNSGAPFARNRGAELADGEYIIFLDADIKLEPHALEIMRQALINNPAVDYAYGDFIWGKRLFRAQEFNEDALRKQNYIHTSALIRRSANPVFDETLTKFQDWDLWLTMLKSNKRGIYVSRNLFTVKERKNGISQWLPSFVYKIPWPILGYTPKLITKYRTAEAIIKKKHGISSSH